MSGIQDRNVERRTLKRRHLIYYLTVFDEEGGGLFGHVVDITTEGLMLISKNPIEKGRSFNVSMDLPDEYDWESKKLVFRLESLWTGRDTNPDFYATGFRIIDPGEKLAGQISWVIKELKFEDY